MRHELDAREYKLLLNPDRFQKTPSEIVANTFWQERLKPIIQKLGDRDGEARHDGRFGAPSERIVRFWDTPTCLLTQADFALRERLPAENGTPVSQQPEITLKLRMPDLFVVAATALPGTGGDPRTTLEEDIAPLEVDDPQQDKTSVIVPVNVRSAVVFHSPPPRPPLGRTPWHSWLPAGAISNPPRQRRIATDGIQTQHRIGLRPGYS